MGKTIDAKPAPLIRSLHIRNFRCFQQLDLHIEAPYVLIAGANGVGKTSLLEALYYACYLRSFRTSSPRELIALDKEDFFVKIEVDSGDSLISHVINVGFFSGKRLVKIDQKPIASYKELMAYYRVVSVTEGDLDLIQGAPQSRRFFMDQALIFLDSEYGHCLKKYRRILDQRNALLQQQSVDLATLNILTRQLWHLSHEIQLQREGLLALLLVCLNERGIAFIPRFNPIRIKYSPRYTLGGNYDEFEHSSARLLSQERRFGRTLFGVHLDDVIIESEGHSSRFFASRGQQKLITLLIKMALLELLGQRGMAGVCLLDDFMTDLDHERAIALLEALRGLGTQIICTSPLLHSPMGDHFLNMGAQEIVLS